MFNKKKSSFDFPLSGTKNNWQISSRLDFSRSDGRCEEKAPRMILSTRKKSLRVLFFSYNRLTIVHRVNRHISVFIDSSEEKRTVKPWKAAYQISHGRGQIHIANSQIIPLAGRSHTHMPIYLSTLVKDDEGVIINIANHSTCRWWWWMLTTTRLCALFICLLRRARRARAYAGGNNSKKIIMITIFSPSRRRRSIPRETIIWLA